MQAARHRTPMTICIQEMRPTQRWGGSKQVAASASYQWRSKYIARQQWKDHLEFQLERWPSVESSHLSINLGCHTQSIDIYTCSSIHCQFVTASSIY